MFFKGMQKNSFIDYPNTISIVVFTGGCNFRCPYCHNGHLVHNKGINLGEFEILQFLKSRKGIIDSVVISGGEPTLHKELPAFIKRLKDLDFKVKLDTNGTNPGMLNELIAKSLIDYIAMDIKQTFLKYNTITSASYIDEITESINLIVNSKNTKLIDAEFRTTVCQPLIAKEDIINIANNLNGFCIKYYLQNYVESDNILGDKNIIKPFDKKDLKEICDMFNFVYMR